MSPDIAAVSADAVHLIHAHLVRLSVIGMTIRTTEPRALHMDRVREAHICRLPRIHEPRIFMPGLDVGVDQSRFGSAVSDAIGVAAGTFFHGRKSGKSSILPNAVTLSAIGDS